MPQTRGPDSQGAPAAKGPLYKERSPHAQRAHTYKGPIPSKYPYRRYVIPIRLKVPYRDNLRPLETIRVPYRQGATVDALQFLQTRGPYKQSDITEKGFFTYRGPLQTMGHYRQGAIIDKEFIRTKGLYSKGPQ